MFGITVCKWTMEKVNRKRNLIAPISIAFVIGSIFKNSFSLK